ncbi:aa3-type cytochrome oxidase subunit II [Streptomonospora nanhaiensis]|uniref:cytochrome-c oxidase n=1 Tax=Streptomonospora nanhaiensis TaxID=1323731 RepID=A0A853BHT7_9ACTN|nr:cytochrome c oxidase subunit 2 [Streptomonospora nanhaiensis]
MSPTRHRNRRPALRRWAPRGAALAALGLAATGCASNEFTRLGVPEPITEQGQRVLTLWQGSWVAAFAVGILVWGLIVWTVIFHRKRSEQLPPQVRYNMPIEALYTVLPIVIIAVLFYFTARDQTVLLDTEEPADTNIEVVGFQWSWQFNYLDQSRVDAEEQGTEPQTEFSVAGTPQHQPTLVLREGDVVHFDLTSPDVIHSFWIPAFAFKMDIIPGQDNEFQVKVQEGTAGTYAGRCAELCGVDHSRMLFTVEVMEPDDYDRWVEEQRQAAADEQQQLESGEELEPRGEDTGTAIEGPGTGDQEGSGDDVARDESTETPEPSASAEEEAGQ